MKTPWIKRHLYAVSLSGFTLGLLFCVGFVLAQTLGNGDALPDIDQNSAIFIGLRLLVYGVILGGWNPLMTQILRTSCLNLDQGKSLDQGKCLDQEKTLGRGKEKPTDTRQQLLSAHRNRVVVYILLYEVLWVQQGWAMLIHVIGR